MAADAPEKVMGFSPFYNPGDSFFDFTMVPLFVFACVVSF